MDKYDKHPERNKAEDILRSREEELRAVIEAAPDGILVVNNPGKVIHSNKRFAEMWRIPGELIRTKSDERLLNHVLEQLEAPQAFLSRVQSLYESSKTDIDVLYFKDGRVFERYSNPLMLEDKVEGRVWIFRDVTERKKAEASLRKAKEEIEAWNKELENRVEEKTRELKESQSRLIQSEKLSAMGQLAAGLAHELNSPLAGLIPLISKFREREKEGSEAYNELGLMLRACEHMARIVREFGSFSRKGKDEFTELKINEIIENTLSFSAAQLIQNGIHLVREYADALPVIKGSKTELQQVVLNMITNARDAMPEGGKLIIRTCGCQDGRMVAMEFIDDGVGIEKKALERLYEPFFTTKKPGEGIGLGLSVSYGIVKRHKGEISVESKTGKGTKFTVLLPAAKQA
ncbi:MAG: PAS-domain containing protein [Nitrospirae bacterium]|nr:PAS-domain containing protein [Nitrospirota bacterium]